MKIMIMKIPIIENYDYENSDDKFFYGNYLIGKN